MADSLLDAIGVTVRFGGNVALDQVSLAAEEGCVTGLIGPCRFCACQSLGAMIGNSQT